MKITYQSIHYCPEAVTARYVRSDNDGIFHFCEVNAARYDLRQGIISGKELPDAVCEAAMARRNLFPSYVEWPL